ncbi:MAG: hypothetical protein FJX59_14670 [Alphaproteobacteria bacterium]|nr:hypothetical protein [Alphaproteobacteria bacterium]
MLRLNVVPTILLAAMLAGCAANSTGTRSGSSGSMATGPRLMSSAEVRETPKPLEANVTQADQTLDVTVVAFDPGLPKDPKKFDKNTWPELRRSEGRYVAVQVRDALVAKEKFGAVRVTPDANFSSDLYVQGRIVESNGESLRVDVTVSDATGKTWYTKKYAHKVNTSWYRSARNKGVEPFQPLYSQVANDLADRLTKTKGATVSEIKSVAAMRFAQNLSPDSFTDALKVKGGRASLIRLPAESDPMMKRVAAVRLRDQMFVDNLQPVYEQFAGNMKDSYQVWQSQSCAEVERQREASGAAVMKGLASLALIAGAVALSDNNTSAGNTAAVIAGTAGVMVAMDAWKDTQEAKVHRGVIDELANSIDGQMATRVIEMDKQTVTLTGNMEEQVQQWRKVMAQIWEAENAAERTPMM